MFRLYAKLDETYLGKWGTLNTSNGFVLLNEADLQELLTVVAANQFKIYSEDGQTFYEVKDGKLVPSTDTDLETNTLTGNEPTAATAPSPDKPLMLTNETPSTEPPPVEHLDDASVGDKLALTEQRAQS